MASDHEKKDSQNNEKKPLSVMDQIKALRKAKDPTQKLSKAAHREKLFTTPWAYNDTELFGKGAYTNSTDFLDFKLTEKSKELFRQGQENQGFIGVADLETGEVHLVPCFNLPHNLVMELDKKFPPTEENKKDPEYRNKRDKAAALLHFNEVLTKANKDDKPFVFGDSQEGCVVWTAEPLGDNTGRAHEKAIQTVPGLDQKRKKCIGFGVFKGDKDHVLNEYRDRSANLNSATFSTNTDFKLWDTNKDYIHQDTKTDSFERLQAPRTMPQVISNMLLDTLLRELPLEPTQMPTMKRDARHKNFRSPVHLAAEKGDLQKVKDFVAHNFYINEVATSNQCTVVMTAAVHGHHDIVNFMLEQEGIDLMIVNLKGETLFDYMDQLDLETKKKISKLAQNKINDYLEKGDHTNALKVKLSMKSPEKEIQTFLQSHPVSMSELSILKEQLKIENKYEQLLLMTKAMKVSDKELANMVMSCVKQSIMFEPKKASRGFHEIMGFIKASGVNKSLLTELINEETKTLRPDSPIEEKMRAFQLLVIKGDYPNALNVLNVMDFNHDPLKPSYPLLEKNPNFIEFLAYINVLRPKSTFSFLFREKESAKPQFINICNQVTDKLSDVMSMIRLMQDDLLRDIERVQTTVIDEQELEKCIKNIKQYERKILEVTHLANHLPQADFSVQGAKKIERIKEMPTYLENDLAAFKEVLEKKANRKLTLR